MSRSRNWCFTDFELKKWDEIMVENEVGIRYICYGVETCPTTGKQHHQGWVQFETPVSLRTAKKRMNFNGHLEACRGSEFDNEKYCKKDGEFFSLGKFKKQGQRVDLEEIRDEILNGVTIEEIAIKYPKKYCQYRNGLRDIAGIVAKNNTKEFREVEVIVIWGETDTGKTRTAMEEAEYKIDASELQWWDGYNGEKTICIDEYDNDVKITKMLNILDGYQLRLPIKGGHTYANWNKVFITSNVDPQYWHENAKEVHRRALFRRITKVIQKV